MPLDMLSQLAGKRIAIGQAGSGTHALSMALLAANGINAGGTTTFEDMDAEDAAKALVDGKVDAAFLMGDVASGKIMVSLFETPGIRIFDFAQADAYTRRIIICHKMDLPWVPSISGRTCLLAIFSLSGPHWNSLRGRTSIRPCPTFSSRRRLRYTGNRACSNTVGSSRPLGT